MDLAVIAVSLNDFDALFAKKGYSSIQEVINEQL